MLCLVRCLCGVRTPAMAGGKAGSILVKLLSSAGTGFFYVKARARAWSLRTPCLWKATPLAGAFPAVPAGGTPLAHALTSTSAHGRYAQAQKKNPKKLPVKLEFMKYDPRVRRHVLFTETKLK